MKLQLFMTLHISVEDCPFQLFWLILCPLCGCRGTGADLALWWPCALCKGKGKVSMEWEQSKGRIRKGFGVKALLIHVVFSS